ncbi:MAG TPA: Crp/Fnr family transcriptional regulator [Stellaceae bacterium]|nr:Crp/Fnr family transcriptional regulator [Stellaceae bacterium]
MATGVQAQGQENQFLASLDRNDGAFIMPHAQTVELPRGRLLTDTGGPIVDAWFPHDAVISFQSVMANGQAVENGTIGREGFAGFSALLGSHLEISRSLVEVPGHAARVPLSVVQSAWTESLAFREKVLLYVRAVLVQLAQSVACAALHSVEQRMARWLLMTHDRVGQDDLALTHEYLGEMLGVQRPTITRTVERFEKAGSIRSRRGRITVQDRAELERAACECYAAVRSAFDFSRTAHTISPST